MVNKQDDGVEDLAFFVKGAHNQNRYSRVALNTSNVIPSALTSPTNRIVSCVRVGLRTNKMLRCPQLLVLHVVPTLACYAYNYTRASRFCRRRCEHFGGAFEEYFLCGWRAVLLYVLLPLSLAGQASFSLLKYHSGLSCSRFSDGI